MKIEFEDKSYIELQKSGSNKVILTVAAKDQFNNRKNIINSVEISTYELEQLINSIK